MLSAQNAIAAGAAMPILIRKPLIDQSPFRREDSPPGLSSAFYDSDAIDGNIAPKFRLVEPDAGMA